MLGHTRNSCRLGTPLESSVGKIQVVVMVELGIQARPGALLVEEEGVVLRQSSLSQVPYEVGRVLDMVVYPLSTKGNDNLVSYK